MTTGTVNGNIQANSGAADTTKVGSTFLDLLDRTMTSGSIEFVIDGVSRRVGNKVEAPEVVVRVSNPNFLDEVLVTGNLALLRNHLDTELPKHLGATMALKMGAIRLANKIRGRFGNIHKHFDIGIDLYEAFLDSSMAYTCGYEKNPTATSTLEELQQQKFARICRKLDLREGDRLADLGCGFGGLIMYAAEHHGITGKGLTISKHQAQKANERIAQKGLSDRIKVEYASFETLTGTYDRIVSVGMLEHLTDAEYKVIGKLIARSLTPQGRGLLHYIGYAGPKNASDPFTQKYVFPGAQWPKLSTIANELEMNELAILDVENLVRHYTLTMQAWLQKFWEAYPSLDHQRYDNSFKRMWEYYLGCGIASSLYSQTALYQILFTKDYAAPRPYQRV
jgi:cyclopropane-fatty-acyl-phospholipid synthase